MTLTTVNRSLRRRSAFTLLEVLVVVAILVILASVATIATTRYLEDARKSKAHLGCKSLEQACEAYVNSPQNPAANGGTFEDKAPQSLQNLLQPFEQGQASFLRNGQTDLTDPWGQQYRMEIQQRPNDGTHYLLIYTIAPDGTKISQFGIGAQNAMPQH